MTNRKIIFSLLVFLFALTTLFSVAILITPWLIDNTSVGGKIRSEVSHLIGGEFDFKQLDLSIIPRPHLVIANPEINLPQHLSASAETIELYLEILPLLRGSFSLQQVLIKQPEITVTVPESTTGKKKSSSPFEISQVVPTLSNALAKLSKIYLPVKHGTISKGNIALVYDNKTVFKLYDVEADFLDSSKNIAFQITAASDIIDKVLVTGSINTEQSKNSAHIELEKLQFGNAYTAFLPDAGLKIHAGDTDITMDFSMENSDQIALDFKLAAPSVLLDRAGQATDIKIQRLAGRLDLNPDAATVTLSELLLENPALDVSGSLTVSEKVPKVLLNLKGQDIDIKSTRLAALALAGGEATIQTVFDILKGGTLPLVSVSGVANSLDELWDLDTLVVKSSLKQADVKIPGVNLELQSVSGDIALSRGKLAGENIQGRVKHSSIQDGRLNLDLDKAPLPLHIEAAIRADAADVPAILKLFSDDRELQNELAQIHDLQGSAHAKLLLDGDTDQLHVDVSATDIQLAARHEKSPYPLSIAGGDVTYDGNQIRWQKLHGSFGASSFASFSGNLDLGETKNFEVASGTSRVDVSEILPWISSYEKLGGIARYYGGGKSILQLSKVRLGGPLKNFHRWHYDIAGEIEDLVLHDLPKNPGPLTIGALKFNADQQKLEYWDGRVLMLDSSVTVSGAHLHYRAGLDKDVSLSFAGQIGPKTAEWLSQITGIPAWVKLKPLALTTSHLSYSNNETRNLTAALASQNGLEMSADVSWNAQDVVVNKLVLKDRDYQASLGGRYKDQSVDLSFEGLLHESTLTQIIQITPYLSGSLGGKARIRLNLKKPYKVNLAGELDGENLHLPQKLKAPLIINKITVRGEPDAIGISSAELTWSDMAMTLIGSIKPGSSETMLVDLALQADSIDVEKIMDSLGGYNKSLGEKSTATPFPLPITGNIHCKTKQLKTKSLTVQPLHADIMLHEDAAEITLKETSLCGIPISGTIRYSPQDIAFNLKSEAKAQPLNTTLNCFSDQHFKADGTFDLDGVLNGHGTIKDLFKTASGHFVVTISNGHIYRDIILLNVMKFLNIAEILTDRVTAKQMLEKGLGFRRFEMQATLKNESLEFEKIILDSDEMILSGAGEFDIRQRQIKSTLLVSAQATANTIMGRIPLIGGVLKTIDTIPLSLQGAIDDVHVIPLEPSAIGYELQEIMRGTLGVPMKLVHIDDFHRSANNEKK